MLRFRYLVVYSLVAAFPIVVLGVLLDDVPNGSGHAAPQIRVGAALDGACRLVPAARDAHRRLITTSQSSPPSAGGRPVPTDAPPETCLTEPFCSLPPVRGLYHCTVNVPLALLKSSSPEPPLARYTR